MPRVSALIVSYNTRDLTLDAVRSALSEPDVEVVVVDNASEDGSADAIASTFPALTLVRSPANLGFAGGVNLAARRATGEAFLLLNPDARLKPGALVMLLTRLEEHSRAAAVGAALVYPDGRPQESAFELPGLAQVALDLFPVPRLAGSRLNGRYPSRSTPFRIGHPLGACFLLRRAAWEDVGPLDEGYFMYVEEVDWCRRAADRGWEIWHEPRAVAVHHGAQSTQQRSAEMWVQLWRSRLRYYQRYSSPAYWRAIRLLVRLGMRAAERSHDPERRAAARIVRRMAR